MNYYKKMTQQLNQLTSRFGHSGVFRNNKAYIFGGFVNSNTPPKLPLEYVNDLIEVDITTQAWKNLNNQDSADNQRPSARYFHSACLRNAGSEMVIFGGKSNGFHKDIWVYHFDDSKWTRLDAKHSDIISPRYGQSATVYGDRLFVFGGYDNNSFTSNELFSFNFATTEWQLVELSVELDRRYYHATVLDEETGDWYIYGGKSATTLTNDIFIIKFSTFY